MELNLCEKNLREKPRQSSSTPRPSENSNACSKDTNRDQEIENGIDLDIDDENTQRAKWRR